MQKPEGRLYLQPFSLLFLASAQASIAKVGAIPIDLEILEPVLRMMLLHFQNCEIDTHWRSGVQILQILLHQSPNNENCGLRVSAKDFGASQSLKSEILGYKLILLAQVLGVGDLGIVLVTPWYTSIQHFSSIRVLISDTSLREHSIANLSLRIFAIRHYQRVDQNHN